MTSVPYSISVKLFVKFTIPSTLNLNKQDKFLDNHFALFTLDDSFLPHVEEGSNRNIILVPRIGDRLKSSNSFEVEFNLKGVVSPKHIKNDTITLGSHRSIVVHVFETLKKYNRVYKRGYITLDELSKNYLCKMNINGESLTKVFDDIEVFIQMKTIESIIEINGVSKPKKIIVTKDKTGKYNKSSAEAIAYWIGYDKNSANSRQETSLWAKLNICRNVSNIKEQRLDFDNNWLTDTYDGRFVNLIYALQSKKSLIFTDCLFLLKLLFNYHKEANTQLSMDILKGFDAKKEWADVLTSMVNRIVQYIDDIPLKHLTDDNEFVSIDLTADCEDAQQMANNLFTSIMFKFVIFGFTELKQLFPEGGVNINKWIDEDNLYLMKDNKRFVNEKSMFYEYKTDELEFWLELPLSIRQQMFRNMLKIVHQCLHFIHLQTFLLCTKARPDNRLYNSNVKLHNPSNYDSGNFIRNKTDSNVTKEEEMEYNLENHILDLIKNETMNGHSAGTVISIQKFFEHFRISDSDYLKFINDTEYVDRSKENSISPEMKKMLNFNYEYRLENIVKTMKKMIQIAFQYSDEQKNLLLNCNDNVIHLHLIETTCYSSSIVGRLSNKIPADVESFSSIDEDIRPFKPITKEELEDGVFYKNLTHYFGSFFNLTQDQIKKYYPNELKILLKKKYYNPYAWNQASYSNLTWNINEDDKPYYGATPITLWRHEQNYVVVSNGPYPENLMAFSKSYTKKNIPAYSRTLFREIQRQNKENKKFDTPTMFLHDSDEMNKTQYDIAVKNTEEINSIFYSVDVTAKRTYVCHFLLFMHHIIYLKEDIKRFFQKLYNSGRYYLKIQELKSPYANVIYYSYIIYKI